MLARLLRWSRTMHLTVDVEARAKERAVIALRHALAAEEAAAGRSARYVMTTPL